MIRHSLFVILGLMAALTLGCEKKEATPTMEPKSEAVGDHADHADDAADHAEDAKKDAAKAVEDAAEKVEDAAGDVKDAADGITIPGQ